MTEATVTPLSPSPDYWRHLDESNVRSAAQVMHTQPRHVLEMLRGNTTGFMACAAKIVEATAAQGLELPPNLVVIDSLGDLLKSRRELLGGRSRQQSGLGLSLAHSSANGGQLEIAVAPRHPHETDLVAQRWRITAFAGQASLHQYEFVKRLPDEAGYSQELTGRTVLTGELADRLQLALDEAAATRPDLRVVPFAG